MPGSTRSCRRRSTRAPCPSVVAMAADRDGPIYEGAAGPRAVGRERPGDARTRMFRIASMTKMVATVAALQQVERGNLDLDAPVEQYLPGVRRPAGARGLRRRHAAAAPAGDARRPSASSSRHTSGLALLVLERRHRALGGAAPARRTCSRATNAIFTAPLVADPGTRYEYGINTDWLGQRGRGGERPDARRLLRRAHPRPARDERDGVPDDDEQRANSVPGPPARRGRRVGADATSTGRRSRSGGPAATGCTRRRATT